MRATIFQKVPDFRACGQPFLTQLIAPSTTHNDTTPTLQWACRRELFIYTIVDGGESIAGARFLATGLWRRETHFADEPDVCIKFRPLHRVPRHLLPRIKPEYRPVGKSKFGQKCPNLVRLPSPTQLARKMSLEVIYG